MDGIVTVRVCRVDRVGERFGATSLRLAELVVAGVDRHSVEPGAERCLCLIAIGFAKDGDEGLLNRIQRRIPVLHHAQADAKDTILVCPDELIEGGDITTQIPVEEFDVLGGPARHARDSGAIGPACHS